MKPERAARPLARPLHALVWGAMAACVLAIDLRTGTEPSLTLFYLFPVAYASWFGGSVAGLGSALASVAVWYLALGVPSPWGVPPRGVVAWNAGVEFGVFALVAWIVASLRRAFERERALRAELESAWGELDREQRQVGRIQRELLPPGLPAPPGWRVAVHYATSRRAGGDYYDFLPLHDGRLGIVLADAAGHGTPAAVVMAVLRALLHGDAVTDEDPATMLGSLGRRLFGNTPEAMFATACWVTLDPGEGRIRWSLAGHCPPLLARADGRVDSLVDGAGLPLGITPEARYESREGCIGPGETLLLYTDGITEAMDAERELFGEERLRAELAARAGEPADALCDHIADAVRAHLRGAAATDDMTLVVLRRER